MRDAAMILWRDFAGKLAKDYGFKDRAGSSTVEYSYDLNGNMRIDENKGLASEEDNFLKSAE